MTHYKPKKLRPWRVPAMALRGLASLLGLWPVLLVAALLFLPVSPHLRMTYTYEKQGAYRHLIACKYLGARGWVQYVRGGECPVIALIDRRVVN